jgi:hypothetical protein
MKDLIKLFVVFFVVLILAIGHVRGQDKTYSEFVKEVTSRSASGTPTENQEKSRIVKHFRDRENLPIF